MRAFMRAKAFEAAGAVVAKAFGITAWAGFERFFGVGDDGSDNELFGGVGAGGSGDEFRNERKHLFGGKPGLFYFEQRVFLKRKRGAGFVRIDIRVEFFVVEAFEVGKSYFRILFLYEYFLCPDRLGAVFQNGYADESLHLFRNRTVHFIEGTLHARFVRFLRDFGYLFVAIHSSGGVRNVLFGNIRAGADVNLYFYAGETCRVTVSATIYDGKTEQGAEKVSGVNSDGVVFMREKT